MSSIDEGVEDLYDFPKEIAPGVAFPDTPGELKNYEVGMMGPNDPSLALNWSSRRKLRVLTVMSFVIMVSAWGSAVIAPATQVMMKLFHVGLPVATLTVSLYVLGYAVGPIVWGPAGALYGRKAPILISCFGHMVFTFASATCKDFQTLVITRFFQGVFGAGSLTIGPAVAGDVFRSESRGTSLTSVAFCVVTGPMIAPVVGGYITQSYLGWRWTMYITGIMSALCCLLVLFLIPESDTKAILRKRAATLREETGNWAIRAPGELATVNIGDLFNKVLFGPMKMLITEPILGLITLYHGFIYGILYMCLEAVPIIYTGFRFKGANVFLPYIAILIGAIVVCVLNIVLFEPWNNKQMRKLNKPVLPENRLPLMIVSGGAFVIGIFWLCWAGAYPQHVHWIVPTIGAGFVGFGMIGIFLACFNYILDTYLMTSSMAFAANTFFRSAFGCAFPLFVHPMFINLGTQWAGTLIGCLSALLFPVPILFYMYGEKLRSMSPFAVSLDDNSKEEENRFAKESESIHESHTDDDFASTRSEP